MTYTGPAPLSPRTGQDRILRIPLSRNRPFLNLSKRRWVMSDREKNLAAKYRWIIAAERSLAHRLEASVRKPRPITVWEVLMPLLLIFTFAGRKVHRETFVQNIIFTKQLALDAAREVLEKRISRETAINPARRKTEALLSTVKNGIYSEAIRERQLNEIELLIDHYCILLHADGKDYVSLVRAAYRERSNYLDFLQRLGEAERAVNEASLKTVGSRGDPEFVSRLQQNTEAVRMATTERIFGGGG